MKELMNHIKEINAESAAWMAESPGRMAGMLVEDPKWWSDRGVFTIEDFKRDEVLCCISDVHKEAYGFRPRGYDFESMSYEELSSLYDRWSEDAAYRYEQEKLAEAEDVEKFKSLVQKTIEMGAGDEETALRWITDSELFYNEQHVEDFVWKNGILFTDYGRELNKKLRSLVTYTDWSEK
jgi:hypothetical protein